MLATGRSSDPSCPEPPAGFDYHLPRELIAQHPAVERDGARLLVMRRDGEPDLAHSWIHKLGTWLEPGDLLVVNRSRVIAARLRGLRVPSGGEVELLLIAPIGNDRAGSESVPATVDAAEAEPRWRAMVRPARRLRPGDLIALAACRDVVVRIELIAEGQAQLAFPAGTEVLALAEQIGEAPLPPYIRRPGGASREDRERYQTVFAREPGSIAAPTAGLHLTQELIAELGRSGVELAEIVLHVGPATFLAGRPGRPTLAVEPERYTIPRPAREAIAAAQQRGRRIVAVGTTTTRALESAARAGWPEGQQTTSLVLEPGARFQVIDALLTNFHLPGSSLLALVSAFAGIERTRSAYQEAVANRYRFYSYGDAMLIL